MREGAGYSDTLFWHNISRFLWLCLSDFSGAILTDATGSNRAPYSGMRFIAGIIIVLTLFLLTKFFKNSVYAIALCSTIFILPLSLVLLNIPGAQYILMNPLLIGNVF